MAKSTSLAAYAAGGNIALADEAFADALDMALDGVTSGGGAGDTKYVKFSGKSGSLTVGADNSPFDPDEDLLLEPTASVAGFTCWKGGSAVAKSRWLIAEHAEKAVAFDDLPDHGPFTRDQDGWKPMLGLSFVGEDGTQYVFETNSPSGRNVVGSLLRESKARQTAGEPHIPLFSFHKETFIAHEQKNWKPKFPVSEWLTRVEAADYLSDDAAPEPAPEPEPEPEVKRTRRTRRS